MEWFAVQTKPRAEFAATRVLKAIGLEVFFPWCEVFKNRRRAGGGVVSECVKTPHFPRYLFVRARWDQLHLVRLSLSVSRIVSFDGAPIPIPSGIMDILTAGADDNGKIGQKDEVSRKRFKAASKVNIKEGPFAGFAATVVKDSGKTDIRLLLDIFGRSTEITVPVAVIAA